MLQKVEERGARTEQRASADAAFAIAMEEVEIAAEQVRDVLRSFSSAAGPRPTSNSARSSPPRATSC